MGHSHGHTHDDAEETWLDRQAERGKEMLPFPENDLGRLLWKSLLPLLTAEGMDRFGKDLPKPLQAAGIGATTIPMFLEYLIPDFIAQVKGGDTADAMMTGLTSTAAIAGALTGENDLVEGASMLNVLFQLAGMFEEGQEEVLKAEIEKLEAQIPHDVERRKPDGEWETVDAHDVVPGDVIRVHPGAMVPFDGEVIAINGSEASVGYVDSRIITGRSILSPVDTKTKNNISQGAYVAGKHADAIHAMARELGDDTLTETVADYLQHGRIQDALDAIDAQARTLGDEAAKTRLLDEAAALRDKVLQASDGAPFTIRVTKRYEDSELMHNIAAVKNAAEDPERKSNRETSIEKYAGRWMWLMTAFVGTQFGIELFRGQGNDGKLTAHEVTSGIRKSLELAIKMAPCPLMSSGLSYPFMLRKLAGSYGIRFANKGALERMEQVDTVVFDMTGPLTLGEPKILEGEGGIYSARGKKKDDASLEAELMMQVAKLEKFASHPVADAIDKRAAELNGQPVTLNDGEVAVTVGNDPEQPKSGIGGTVGDATIHIGSESFIRDDVGVTIPQPVRDEMDQLRSQGRIVSLVHRVQDGKTTWQVISFDDELRQTEGATLGAADVVAELQGRGKRVIIATGDSRERAAIIAAKLGIAPEDVHGDLKGTQKQQLVENLQKEGRTVLMVGDGNNDAPALMAADVSCAIKDMGGRLSEAAAQAQINHISEIPKLMNISEKVNQHAAHTSLFAKLWMGFLTGTHIFGIKIGPVLASIFHEVPTAVITWLAGNSTERIATAELGAGNGSTDMSFSPRQAWEFARKMIEAVGQKVGLGEKDGHLADTSGTTQRRVPDQAVPETSGVPSAGTALNPA